MKRLLSGKQQDGAVTHVDPLRKPFMPKLKILLEDWASFSSPAHCRWKGGLGQTLMYLLVFLLRISDLNARLVDCKWLQSSERTQDVTKPFYIISLLKETKPINGGNQQREKRNNPVLVSFASLWPQTLDINYLMDKLFIVLIHSEGSVHNDLVPRVWGEHLDGGIMSQSCSVMANRK